MLQNLGKKIARKVSHKNYNFYALCTKDKKISAQNISLFAEATL
jgi:hypothetical protein